MFDPFPVTMDESKAADLIRQYVQGGGDGSCVEGRWHQVPPGLTPAVIEKTVKPFLNEKTPDIQIQDAMNLVAAYRVTGLAGPLQAFYESEQMKKSLDPETAANVLSALVQISTGTQKTWLDREVQARIAGDVWPTVGEKTVSADWLSVIWQANDLSSMNTLEKNAKAYIKQNKAKELVQTDEGLNYRKFSDWTTNTLRHTRESLEKKSDILSKPTAGQMDALVPLYLNPDGDPTSRMAGWAAHHLRGIAMQDSAQLSVLIEAFRRALQAMKNDRAAIARAADAIRYFGGSLSIAEQQVEAAALKKIDYQLFFPLSMRRYYRNPKS